MPSALRPRRVRNNGSAASAARKFVGSVAVLAGDAAEAFVLTARRTPQGNTDAPANQDAPPTIGATSTA
jgi:hypothetical protein